MANGLSAVEINNAEGALSGGKSFSIPRFSLAQGQQLALLGRSGSGKSTLLNLLSGMLPVSQGSLKLFGDELVGLKESARDQLRRKQVGMVFQTYHLLAEFSVLENVCMGAYFSKQAKENPKARAMELLAQVGLAGEIHRRPHELSVGQQQRVAIARALIKSPALILADEPTGALDAETGKEVCEVLQTLATELGSTLVFVTHDQSLAATFSEQIQVSTVLQWKGGSQ